MGSDQKNKMVEIRYLYRIAVLQKYSIFVIEKIAMSHLRWFGQITKGSPTTNGTDPGPFSEIVSHSWLEISGDSRRSWHLWLGIERSGLTFSVCCHSNPGMERRIN